MNEEQLKPEEIEELQTYLGGAPMPEEKYNHHAFLHKVATAKDTTKLGYLKDEELGVPKHPVRTMKNLALISDKILDNPYYQEFFEAESEIVTATSLSREGKLLELSVTDKREVRDTTKKPVENKGWFKKKDKEGGEE